MPNFITSQDIDRFLTSPDGITARRSLGLTELETLSALWEDTRTAVQANSAVWDDTTTFVQTNSSTWKNSQQTITSSNSALDLDVSQGYSALTTLTEHLTGFTISNAVSGDSGMIVVSSDGGGWTFPANIQPSIVMSGDLADIATLTNAVSSRATISWYYDGQYNYLDVSNTIT